MIQWALEVLLVSDALSVDLRERVVGAWERGEGTQEEVAARFGVGVASVVRWVALKRETGSLKPRPKPGRQRTLTEEHRALLLQLAKAQGDRTREDLADELVERGGPRVSVATIGRELKRAGWTRKKNGARR